MASILEVNKNGGLSILRSAASRAAPLTSPLIQLCLVLLLIQQYQLESRTFFNIAVLSVAGFAIHALLPLAHRLSFFALLSVVGVGVAFGLRDGGFLLALGLILIGFCHLPTRLRYRVALLLVTAGILATGRAGLVDFPWSSAVWPILASMFMFRLAVYLYALHYERAPVSPARTLAYFFMLPNVCFPLYPVVDYATFNRTYYDRPDTEIYDRGVQWIVRGLVHLLLYRFIYLNLANDPATVASLSDLLQYMLATFGLYLRVSGQFHLIVGMLHLFGFRLPETHRLYYLASSFTDFWRRINIYWKDFMMKLVYYPSFVALKPRLGERSALIAATIVVFIGTWLLHSYQWFWLRGGFPLTAQDGLFWGVLGGFVVINSLREMRRGRKRPAGRSTGWNARLGVQTALMFWTMTVLWSLWSSESVGGWLGMLRAAANVDLLGVAIIVVVTAMFLYLGGANQAPPQVTTAGAPFYRVPAIQNSVILLGLLMAGQPQVQEQGGARYSGLVSSLQSSTLNARDEALQHQGYYEQLDNSSRLSAELWELRQRQPSDWMPFRESQAYVARNDFMQAEIRPNLRIDFHGAPFTSNRWGMRDREYSVAKPEGTFRVAFMGPSHVMGYGVADDDTVDEILETRLAGDAETATRVEILNFGVAGYSLLQQVALLDERVLQFDPDVVIVTVPPAPVLQEGLVDHLMEVLEEEVTIPYEDLRERLSPVAGNEAGSRFMAKLVPPVRYLFRQIGLQPVWTPRERFLRDSYPELVNWALARIDRLGEQGDFVPVLVSLDIVARRDRNEEEIRQLARLHGVLYFDLTGIWDGYDVDSLRVAPWDNHPNAAGNRLIAERLYQEFLNHEQELGLDFLPTVSAFHAKAP